VATDAGHLWDSGVVIGIAKCRENRARTFVLLKWTPKMRQHHPD
jgi:hypothetical protein